MKFRKLLSTLLVCALLAFAFVSPASAAVPPDNTVSPQYSDTTMVYAGLTRNSLGFFVIEGGVTADNVHKYTEVTVTLQKYVTGTTWEDMDGFIWTGNGIGAAGASAIRSVSPSGSYRAHCVAKVYTSDGLILLETTEANSATLRQ